MRLSFLIPVRPKFDHKYTDKREVEGDLIEKKEGNVMTEVRCYADGLKDGGKSQEPETAMYAVAASGSWKRQKILPWILQKTALPKP